MDDPKRNRLSLLLGLFTACLCAGRLESAVIPTALARAAISHPRLTPYLHPEVSGRLPLIIADSLLEPGFTAVSGGHPVRVMPSRELLGSAFIRFTRFIPREGSAQLELEYPVEGIVARFEATRGADGEWQIADAVIIER